MTTRSQQVRSMSSEALHAIAGSLRRQQYSKDLSEPQEWLWRTSVRELERRRRRAHPLTRCGCDLCRAPFPAFPE